jgi:hypothetical protein
VCVRVGFACVRTRACVRVRAFVRGCARDNASVHVVARSLGRMMGTRPATCALALLQQTLAHFLNLATHDASHTFVLTHPTPPTATN